MSTNAGSFFSWRPLNVRCRRWGYMVPTKCSYMTEKMSNCIHILLKANDSAVWHFNSSSVVVCCFVELTCRGQFAPIYVSLSCSCSADLIVAVQQRVVMSIHVPSRKTSDVCFSYLSRTCIASVTAGPSPFYSILLYKCSSYFFRQVLITRESANIRDCQ